MTFEEIKRSVNIIDVARNKLGLELQSTGNTGEWRGRSIFEAGNNLTCLKIDEIKQCWIDFKGGKEYSGSVLDLVAFVKYGHNDKSAIIEAAKFLSGDNFNADYWTKYTTQRDEFQAGLNKYQKELLHDARTLEYLHARRISDKFIKENALGLISEWVSDKATGKAVEEWRLAIPCFDENGTPVYLVTRQLDWTKQGNTPKYHKKKASEFFKPTIYGRETMPRNDKDFDILIVGEGVFDAMSCKQEGYKVLFAIGGYPGGYWDKYIMDQAKRAKRVVLMFDSDKPGQSFTVRYSKMLHKIGVNFSCVRNYGEGKKDVSDFYVGGGNIQTLINNAVDGYDFLADNICKSEYSYRDLSVSEKQEKIKQARNFLLDIKDAENKARVLAIFRLFFPDEAMQRIEKDKSQNEILCEMRDSFLAERHIIFYGSIKRGNFFAYDERGYWSNITDAMLQSDINNFFGGNLDNKLIRDIFEKVRLESTVKNAPKFNKKNLLNFRNGVLDLNTREFRQAKPEDFLTFQLRFDYIPGLRNEAYEKFLLEVMNENHARLRFLRQMLGYIFYSDNSLDKAFFLIGEGRNGKSTFIDILNGIFRNANESDSERLISSISLSKLGDPTYIINLMPSMINLCAENDIIFPTNSVAPFKAVVAGDYVNGNYKYHDLIPFVSRAKFITACQKTPKIPDNSNGIKARMAFVKFEADFSKEYDTEIAKKILQNPSGIINYIIDCYFELKKQGKIIPYEADQQEYMKEFEIKSNSVVAFIDDVHESHEQKIVRGDLFKMYLDWSKSLNIREPFHKGEFYKEIRKQGIQEGRSKNDIAFIIPAATEPETSTNSTATTEPETSTNSTATTEPETSTNSTATTEQFTADEMAEYKKQKKIFIETSRNKEKKEAFSKVYPGVDISKDFSTFLTMMIEIPLCHQEEYRDKLKKCLEIDKYINSCRVA